MYTNMHTLIMKSLKIRKSPCGHPQIMYTWGGDIIMIISLKQKKINLNQG